MNGLIVALRLLAASQVLLFACVLMTSGSAPKLRVPGIVLATCVIAYLLIPLAAPYLGAAVAVAGLLANAIPPALFWFTWVVFEDPGDDAVTAGRTVRTPESRFSLIIGHARPSSR